MSSEAAVGAPAVETPTETTVPAAATDVGVASSADAAAAPAASAASVEAAQQEAKRFLLKHKEKLKMNQYWSDRRVCIAKRELTPPFVWRSPVSTLAASFLSPLRYSLPTIAAMVTEAERESKRACFLSTPSIFFSLNDKALQANSKVFDYDEMWSKHPGFVKYDYKKVEEIPKELYGTFDFIVIDPPFITAEVWADYAKAAKLLLVPGTEEIEIDTATAEAYHASLVQSHAAGVASAKGEVNGTSFAGNIASMLSNALGGGGAAAGSSSTATVPPLPASPRPSSTPGRSLVIVPRGKLLLSTIPEHAGYLFMLLGCYQPRFRPSIPNLIYQYSLYINYPSQPLMKLNPEIDEEEPAKEFTSKKKNRVLS